MNDDEGRPLGFEPVAISFDDERVQLQTGPLRDECLLLSWDQAKDLATRLDVLVRYRHLYM